MILCLTRNPGILSSASIGMWLSLVERCVRDAEVVGSNPAIPTINAVRLRVQILTAHHRLVSNRLLGLSNYFFETN